MRNIFNYIILSLTISTFASCQEELVEIQEPPAEDAFTADANVATLVKRVALNDGSKDNVISGASCVAFALPVTVVVNGQELVINSEEGYDKIEKILDQFMDDDDLVQIAFPITIILADYTEVLINNEDQLEDYLEECIEGGFDDDIECVDFKYPINISVYDSKNQTSNVLSVNNDKELFKFLDELEDNIYVSLDFPITIILSDGSEVIAKNNDQLEEIIENSEDDCDEDDDNDFDDDDTDTSGFNIILTGNDWKITYFFDETDQTEMFDGWIFTFNDNKTLLATNDKSSFTGSWSSYGDSGTIELELDFDSEDPVEELNEEWEVLEFNDVIKMEDTSGGDPVMVTFEKYN